MKSMISHLKPGAFRVVHLLVAALIWNCVGIFLMLRGIICLYGIGQMWIILPGLLVGTVKARFMLDRSARKNIRRIVEGSNGRCLGGVYSWKTWTLVLLMIAMGCFLRNSSLPKEFLGLLYVSIGWGLFFSSRLNWLAWRTERVKVEQKDGR